MLEVGGKDPKKYILSPALSLQWAVKGGRIWTAVPEAQHPPQVLHTDFYCLARCLLYLHFYPQPPAQLVHACPVHRVDPLLVEVDEEDEVVTEAGQAVHGGHLDDESEQVVDESVEGLVDHHTPGQVGHTLHLVVDEELGGHEDEAKGVDEADERGDDPRVPALVLHLHQRVQRVPHDQRADDVEQVAHCHLVVLFRARLAVRFHQVHFKPGHDAAALPVRGQLHHLGHLPDLDQQPHGRADEDHPAGLVVGQVQQDHGLEEAVREDRAEAQP
eukprot:CAMPEP_0113940086 /NCGR_PEP_ID=MMETSP1339-20121228/6271_1 /TAXON_ID=94617 /ORGANISM="Fibrocapsa japonica" /LENGTH=272 /DNA_ID=CAMNT_0000943775 /DNA_START=65 /DNA_END=881 /DNA_ORIENTATION=- /assembly_acc=CAM_ASM_000762